MKTFYLSLLFFFGFLVSFVFGQTEEVSVQVFGLGLVIGTPSNLNLGSFNPGDTIEFSFDDYFWVEDLRGVNTGYYTTIQCDGLYGPSNALITGIQLSGSSIDLLAGMANNTLIYSNLTSWTDITEPKLYHYKNDGILDGYAGNRYGNKPAIRISVPEDVPAGTYKGQITYTLYDMGFNY